MNKIQFTLLPFLLTLLAVFQAKAQNYWKPSNSCPNVPLKTYIGNNGKGFQFNIANGRLWRAPSWTSNWVEVFAPVNYNGKQFPVVGIEANNYGHIYLVAAIPSSNNYNNYWYSGFVAPLMFIYRSVDNGNTWQILRDSGNNPGFGGSGTGSFLNLRFSLASDNYNIVVAYQAYHGKGVYGSSCSVSTFSIPTIGWCNLQFPSSATINTCGAADFYAQVWADGLTNFDGNQNQIEAWIGVGKPLNCSGCSGIQQYTWRYYPAKFNKRVGNNYEYMASIPGDIGNAVIKSLFRLGPQEIRGGLGGVLTNSTIGNSVQLGQLNVTSVSFGSAQPGWANLQWPPSATISLNGGVDVFGRVWAGGITPSNSPRIRAWLGVSQTNNHPSSSNWWWFPMEYAGAVGNNAEYRFRISALPLQGTFYYTTRYQLDCGQYYYGGFNASGGGAWNGFSNVSGVLTINGNRLEGMELSSRASNSLWAYPNPSKGAFTLSFSCEREGWANVEVIDLAGKTIYQNSHGAVLGQNELTIELASKPGIYFVRLNTEDGQKTTKVIIE